MTEPLNLDEIKPWLALCGYCDAGLPQSCTCPQGDYRPVMLRLVEEIERMRGEAEPVNDIDATGECCCAGCIGMGPCDLDLGRSDDDGEDWDDGICRCDEICTCGEPS